MSELDVIKNRINRLKDKDGKADIFEVVAAIRWAIGETTTADVISEHRGASIFATVVPEVSLREDRVKVEIIKKYTIQFSGVTAMRGTPILVKETIETKEYL